MTRPLLVFSHANGFPSGTYRKFLDELSGVADVIAPDMYGHDPRFPVDDNWGNLALELLAFLRERADRPVYGIGHSMGAMVTFMAAHREPERFRAIVMLDPPVINGFAAYPFQVLKWLGRADPVTPAGKSKFRRTVWPSREAALAELSRKKLFANFDPDCMRAYVESGTEPCAEGVQLRYRLPVELAGFRTTPSNPHRFLRPLRVPGLLVTGETSDVARPDHVARLHRRHRMEHRVMPGGHLFPLEHPLETAQAIATRISAWERELPRGVRP
ncbi:MAG: alpha/beta fold hydrolase [Pseudomonadota bacterium]